MKIKKLDGVNYVQRTIPLATGGDVTIPGLTVRALRSILDGADPDAMVTYLFEQDDRVVFGAIGGCGFNDDLCFLLGPEVANADMADTDEPIVDVTPPVDRSQTTTTNGKPLDQSPETDDRNGQHSNYVILTDEERAKGFVRPVRDAYKHLECGAITTMGRAIAETYARDPKFYGATYCVKCKGHFPVGEDGEFVWYEDDGSIGPKVGT